VKSHHRRSIAWPAVRLAPDYPRKLAGDKAAAPIDKSPHPATARRTESLQSSNGKGANQ